MTPSAICAEADAAAGRGQAVEAEHLLSAAAERGDPEAAFQLALWALSGQLIIRDLAKAKRYFTRASDLGHAEATAIDIAFTAAGIGGPAEWTLAVARLASGTPAMIAQHALIAAMDLLPDGRPTSVPEVHPMVYSPPIALVSRLFTPAECQYLIDTAKPMLEPSVVIEPRTGRFIRDTIRTSDVAAFPLMLEDPVIHALNLRLAAITGTAVRQGEPLQVMRYAPGQQYRLHSDAIGGIDNQRILTTLIWLNNDYDGGETIFPAFDLKFRGEPGDALIFSNTDNTGNADLKARHAGLPAKRGTKFLASRWIRARALI